jgi:hypothetical protein
MIRWNLHISSATGRTYRSQVLQSCFCFNSQTFKSDPIALRAFVLCQSCLEYTLSVHCDYIVVLLRHLWTLHLTRPLESGGKNTSVYYVNKHTLQPPASLPTATPDTHSYTRSSYTTPGSYKMVRDTQMGGDTRGMS